MQNDVPAAFPLLALIAGLSSGPSLLRPAFAAIALTAAAGLLLAMRGALLRLRVRSATALLFLALGIVLAARSSERATGHRRAVEGLDPDRFTRIEAPIRSDWSARGNSQVLRAPQFRANGTLIAEPIAIYARFDPPPIADQAEIVLEGFLRTDDEGHYSVAVKAPALMACRGRLSRLDPAWWNRALFQRLDRHFHQFPDEVALAQALALGRGERLTSGLRESFRRGGTYHLLVFSGLQIAFAAGLLAALLRWLHAPRASDWLLLAFALLAPSFIGSTASVSRASTAIGLYALSRIAGRPTSMTNLWCVAAMLRLIVEPRDLTDVSFQLTYAGAGALLFAGRVLTRPAWLGHAVAAEAAITPITLFHFHQYALGGSLATLAMSPLIFAMLVMSAAAIAVPCAVTFGALGWLHRLCTMVNRIAFSGFFAAPSTTAMVCGAAAALAALPLLRARARAVAVVCATALPLLSSAAIHLSRRSTDFPQVTFLDVGQGDSILLRSGRHSILVDGGGRSDDDRFGETRLLPLLVDRGVPELDAVLLTHAHPDHCGGLPAVIEHLRVGTVWISPRRFRGECAASILEACRRTATPIQLVHGGEAFSAGALRAHLDTAGITFRRAPENNSSIVATVTAGARRFLLTGDIEREAELALAGSDFRADVLKVAHHGSRSSSGASFLDSVSPRIAVISCGRKNLFGHPHAAVLQSLRQRHVRVWRTDRDGSVTIDLRGDHLYVRGEND